MNAFLNESWTVSKPAVVGNKGMVASQHAQASAVGVEVLRQGGNAVDAAVAMGLAIGCVEPWMSGIGGGGFMVVYHARERQAYCVDFGMVAPRGLDPATYPLREARAGDMFGWPGVVDDRNIHGPHSIAIPGHVAGMALALETFGTRSWGDSLQPAIALARQGMLSDWYGTVMIASSAEALRRYDEAARTYLPDQLPPTVDWSGAPRRIIIGNLERTLCRLADVGPQDFYTGEIAQSIARDARALGAPIAIEDLADYQAMVSKAEAFTYRDATLFAPSGLNAGPTLRHALALLEEATQSDRVSIEDYYAAYAKALTESYAHRLATMGDADEQRGQSCTTHLSVVDKDGNMVALTQTLLSTFGSRVMLPESGILMNNGIMWFDPRPNLPNSIRPGRRPLSNMCPAILELPGRVPYGPARRYALGASGGRRIMPAVMQLISFMVDHGDTAEAALARPRIDCNGSDILTVDAALSPEIQRTLSAQFKIRSVPNGVYPPQFACPGLAGYQEAPFSSIGASHVMSPWTKAEAE